MTQTVKLKRSAVPGKAPITSDMELGEIAINTYDGKLFMKKDDGTASIVEVGGGVSDKNVDGGSPDSVYLVAQTIDGGTP